MFALVLQHAVSLTQQLNYYKEYQSKVVNMVGTEKANAIFSGAIHLLSAGSSDFIQNYYVYPLWFWQQLVHPKVKSTCRCIQH